MMTITRLFPDRKDVCGVLNRARIVVMAREHVDQTELSARVGGWTGKPLLISC
jgi:hypothetical protein